MTDSTTRPERRQRSDGARSRRAILEASAVLASTEGLRGLTISHPEWIRKSRMRGGLRARWLALFDVSMSCCARQCRA